MGLSNEEKNSTTGKAMKKNIYMDNFINLKKKKQLKSTKFSFTLGF